MLKLCVAAALVAGVSAQGQYTRRDLYSEMNVTRDSTKKDIKRMYQKWSRMLHPDHTQWDKTVAKKRMIQISEAYEVLGDQGRRDHYDRTGMMDTGTDSNTEERRKVMLDGENDIFVIKHKDVYKKIEAEGDNWMIFLWSVRYADSLDAGMTWMRFASRMKGIVNVGAIACDDDLMGICRDWGIRQLPTGVYLKGGQLKLYTGKVEQQSMVDFAATHLLDHADRAILDYTHGMTVRSLPLAPHLEKAFPGSSLTSGAHLAPGRTTASTLAANEQWDLVTFEYTDCMDCRIELRLAVEALARSSKEVPRVVRVDCSREANRQFCSQSPQQEGRAWNIAHARRSTYYAPSAANGWKEIETTRWDFEPFTHKSRRYTARDLITFVYDLQRSTIIKLTPASFTKTVLKTKTAWAVSFSSREGCDACADSAADWEMLSRIAQGYVSSKGTKLRVGSIDCTAFPAFCSSWGFGNEQLPALRLWGGGLQRKEEPPFVLRRQDPYSMLNEIKREIEALSTVQITPEVYRNEIMSEEGKKGNWFILWNAGTWCPPCNQVRESWKKVSRNIDESPVSSKVRIGVADCDADKALCNEAGIDSYPTFELRKEGDIIRYEDGDRRPDPVSTWAIQQLDNYVIKLDARKVTDLSRDRTQPSVIAFAAGDWCPPCNLVKGYWKTLSKRLYPLKFGIINCDDNGDLCGKYGIGGYPGLVIYPNGPETPGGEARRRPAVKYNIPQRPTVDVLTNWIKETVPWVKWDPRPED